MFKKDIDYKLSQIQISSADIDTLDKSLRSAMQEVQHRVLIDFDNFTDAQKQKYGEFTQKIKEESEENSYEISEGDQSARNP